MRDHLLLFINGQPVRVGGADAFLTLSEFLRRRQRLTGTKVVCAEGDCGSCAVLVGRIDAGRIRYTAVTSCIQLLFQLDAAHVVTVEGLRDGSDLNPIQQSLVQCQGTQCGFCTPGFVVSLYGLMHEGKPCDAHAVRRGLVGNLCRCTGYDSITRAALATDRAALKSLDTLYPPGPILAELEPASRQEVLIDAPPRRFYKPVAVEAAIRFLADNAGAAIVSGATDLGVLHNKLVRPIAVAMSTAGLAELRAITADAGTLTVGAAATLSDFERAAIEHVPELGAYMAWFGSPLIKNAGTLVGNLVTGSPIGDTLPPLTVLDAEVELAGTNGRRRVPLGEFYTGYRQTVLAPDELVTAVRIPLLKSDETLKLYKVSRRQDLDISSFSAAFWLRRTGDRIDDLRITYGGVGPTVLRLRKAEAVLRGHPMTRDRFEHAAQIARDEVAPLSDVRGSEAYRRALSANVLLKLWHELTDSGGDNGDGSNNGQPHTPPGDRLLQPASTTKGGR